MNSRNSRSFAALRMTRLVELSELEEDVDSGGGIHGPAVTHGGLEAHALSGADGGFVEAVPQAAYHAQDFHIPGNGEVHL